MSGELNRYVPCCCLVRKVGRVSALLLFGLWAVLFMREGATLGIKLNPSVYVQGLSLAIVFLGYFIAWKHEVVGSVLAIIGALGLFACSWAIVGRNPQFILLLFAFPAILMLLSRWLETHVPHNHHPKAA